MPIYEFRCHQCNTFFEVLVSSAGVDEVVCKECGSRDVKKTISAANFRLGSASGGGSPAGSRSGCSPKSGFS